MKRNAVSIFATLTLLVCAAAFAWIDPGAVRGDVPGQSQSTSFEQEMRDLRQIIVHEQATLARLEGVPLTFEQEMMDLRRNIVRAQAVLARPESVELSFRQEMQDLRRAFIRERIAVEQREVVTRTLEQEMRDLRAEIRASQNGGVLDVIRFVRAP